MKLQLFHQTALQNAPRDKHDNILHHQKSYLNPFHDPLNPPKGTQYVYHEKVGDGDMQCRAWVDSGKVKGWFVK